ncbi:MAG: hypothetical protein IJH64_14315, partial [Oscillospiraceae bacterium]|nr:hypothetical protein [Oscillospiraceae bacterium]
MGTIAIFSRLDFFDPGDNKIPGYDIILTELYREEIPNTLVKIIRKHGYFGANAMIKHCSEADMYDIAIYPDVQITKNAVRVL